MASLTGVAPKAKGKAIDARALALAPADLVLILAPTADLILTPTADLILAPTADLILAPTVDLVLAPTADPDPAPAATMVAGTPVRND